MRHRSSKKTLGRNYKQRKALVKNLANSLILHEKIKTTETKAKILKPKIEKMITTAKNNSLHSRRLLIKQLPNTKAAKKMIEVIGPRYKQRQGGYVRIVKLNPRHSDGAKMALIELV